MLPVHAVTKRPRTNSEHKGLVWLVVSEEEAQLALLWTGNSEEGLGRYNLPKHVLSNLLPVPLLLKSPASSRILPKAGEKCPVCESLKHFLFKGQRWAEPPLCQVPATLFAGPWPGLRGSLGALLPSCGDRWSMHLPGNILLPVGHGQG